MTDGESRRRSPPASSARIEPTAVHIERLVPGGAGFGRLADGRAAMVRGTVPGDLVQFRITRDKKSFVEGDAAEILEPSKARIDPPCPVARECGGCDWMMLERSEQQRQKRGLLEQALRRTGGFDQLPEIAFEAHGEPLRYRSRIRLQVQDGRVGFFSARSHDLVEVEDCLVTAPEVVRLLGELREVVRRTPGAFDAFRHVEVRSAPGEERGSYFFVPKRPGVIGAATRAAFEELSSVARVRVQGHRDLVGRGDFDQFELGGLTLRFAPGTFSQVNWEVNCRLVARVVEATRGVGAESFADLYCGAGNFVLPLLQAGLSGVGVEVSAESIDAARRGVEAEGARLTGNVELTVGDVARVARSWAGDGRRFDVVVVDPPRAGAKEALDAIVALAKRRVVMVSCDPVTLARDLRGLVDRGLRLVELAAFDMFPQTHHVEGFAVLDVMR